jgi:hypothetical protein
MIAPLPKAFSISDIAASSDRDFSVEGPLAAGLSDFCLMALMDGSVCGARVVLECGRAAKRPV